MKKTTLTYTETDKNLRRQKMYRYFLYIFIYIPIFEKKYLKKPSQPPKTYPRQRALSA